LNPLPSRENSALLQTGLATGNSMAENNKLVADKHLSSASIDIQNKTAADTEPVKQTTSIRMIVTLGLVAMFSGLLVVLTWQLTYAPIRENQRIMIETAIFKVVPGAVKREVFYMTEQGVIREADYNSIKISNSSEHIRFYAAYNHQNQLQGIAAEGAAQGYADMVKLLYGYQPSCRCIRGFSIIKMAETPGLGDKILTDSQFLANFDALSADTNTEQTALIHDIVTVKSGSKTRPWEIDAISGATITSNAVGKAINQSAQNLIPKIQKYLTQISVYDNSEGSQDKD
jgi:electron transport complex protein RnfG